MTNIEILRTFNAWRRDEVGDRTLDDFGITPRMIGEALDAVIKDAERYRWITENCDIDYRGHRPDGDYASSDEVIDAAMAVSK